MPALGQAICWSVKNHFHVARLGGATAGYRPEQVQSGCRFFFFFFGGGDT